MLVRISEYYDTAPDTLSAAQIKEYLYYCREKQGLSVSFINQTISALKILFEDVQKIAWDETLAIKRPRNNHHLPVILSRKEVRDMIELTTNPKHKALIALMYSSGIRRDELINLRLSDIDSDRMVIRVRNGKGNKSRDTILSPKALTLLRDYFKTSNNKPKEYVFESIIPGKPYSASSMRNVIEKAVCQSNIKKAVTIHSLRHAFATHLLEQGANIKQIQHLMGHQSLSSTMVYLHLVSVTTSKIISPLDAKV